MKSCWRSKTNSRERVAFTIGGISCVLSIASLLSACQVLREADEMLKHKAIECVYTGKGKICKEGKS